MAEASFSLRNQQETQALFGKHDRFLRQIEQHLKVTIVLRREQLIISGSTEHIELTKQVLEALLMVVRAGGGIREQDVTHALKSATHTGVVSLKELYDEQIEVAAKKRCIVPRTPGQKKYVQTIRSQDLVFGIGPAGTGKTYLAMAMAVESLMKGNVARILLTRPAVEAGERLGFLPGDLAEKINPYLRPLYDALYDMMNEDMIHRYLERGIIQVAPLAYMRGRTLSDAFVILDEAQNTTGEQMKMFLTRMGHDCKMVITGDVTQIDLPTERVSGLIQAQRVLHHVQGIGFAELTSQDVVRHALVQVIVDAYQSAAA